uniref:Uncharacterized protein n=1 Tax=Myripristis murdjan TaxID=586833 RepID=A0A668AD16_9TELE
MLPGFSRFKLANETESFVQSEDRWERMKRGCIWIFLSVSTVVNENVLCTSKCCGYKTRLPPLGCMKFALTLHLVSLWHFIP